MFWLNQSINSLMLKSNINKYIIDWMYCVLENYRQSDEISECMWIICEFKIMPIKAKYNYEPNIIAMFNLKFSWKLFAIAMISSAVLIHFDKELRINIIFRPFSVGKSTLYHWNKIRSIYFWIICMSNILNNIIIIVQLFYILLRIILSKIKLYVQKNQ